MRVFFFVIAAAVLVSCSNTGKNYKKDEYLDKEIVERFKALTLNSKPGDRKSAMADSISQAVNALLLLSADIENADACINQSNTYFARAAKLYNIEHSDFILLTNDRPLSENIRVIKTNELNLLNKILLEENKSGEQMFTAQ